MILQNLYVKKYSCKTGSHLYENLEQLAEKLDSASPTGRTLETVTRGLEAGRIAECSGWTRHGEVGAVRTVMTGETDVSVGLVDGGGLLGASHAIVAYTTKGKFIDYTVL